MKILLLSAIIAVTSFAGFGQSKFNQIDLSVNGVRSGSTYQYTIKRLGKPLRETVDPQRNECTGGYSRTLKYDGLVVMLDGRKSGKNANVVRIEVTSAKWNLSSGIKIGATTAEIKSLLGEPAAYVDDDLNRWVYELPEKDGPGAFDLEFKDEKLVNVTVLATIC